MDTTDNERDARFEQLRQWLDGLGGLDTKTLRPASGDASFRRYFRLDAGSTTRVVMDAPPGREECGPYIRIAGLLRDMGLNAPRILEADTDAGFLLMTDLGSTQYLAELQDYPANADALYGDALRALATMQSAGEAMQAQLPPYDEKLLRFELSLFSDWLCERHLGIRFSTSDAQEWQRSCDLLVDTALSQPVVFVHRDYHSRNLMVVTVNNPGILDFQDAVAGPLTYDLVSLLKDCYIRWPANRVQDWAHRFYGMAGIAQRMTMDAFMRSFELMGVQRQLKASGIFARLNHRDGKPAYLRDVPRTLGYIAAIADRYTELAFLDELIAVRVLPRLGGT